MGEWGRTPPGHPCSQAPVVATGACLARNPRGFIVGSSEAVGNLGVVAFRETHVVINVGLTEGKHPGRPQGSGLVGVTKSELHLRGPLGV